MPPTPEKTARLVKLRDAENEIAKCFDPASRPSRNTVIAWIEEGLLSGQRIGSGNNYYVYETSLVNFINGLQPEHLRQQR